MEEGAAEGVATIISWSYPGCFCLQTKAGGLTETR